MAGQYRVVVLGKRDNRLFIATADPTDQEAVEKIKFATQMGADWVIVEHDKLSKAWSRPARPAPTRRWTASSARLRIRRHRRRQRHRRTRTRVAAEVEDAPGRRASCRRCCIDAINLRASDLHFEPYEYHYRVRFRVDGELREITQPPIAIKDKLASRIKVISRLDISEKRVPQDGRMKLKFGAKAIDFRVSTLPTLFGEKIVIRILDPRVPKWASRRWATRRSRRTGC